MKQLVFQIWMDLNTTHRASVNMTSAWVPAHTPPGSPKELGMPLEWQRARRRAISMSPSWTFALIGASDARTFLTQYLPGALSVYDTFPLDIQRIDFVRLALLYVYGGIYFDLDYEVLRPLDSIRLEKPVGLMRSINAKTYVTNSILVASVAQHPFWLECIRESSIPPSSLLSKVSQHAMVMESAGPGMLTRVWKRHLNEVDILDVSVPCSVCDAGAETCSKLGAQAHVFRPLRGTSWHAWDSKVIRLVHCNWRRAVSVATVILILVALWKRNKTSVFGRW